MVLVPNTEYPKLWLWTLAQLTRSFRSGSAEGKCHLSLCCSLLCRKDKTKMMKNYRKRRWVCHQGMFILRPSVPLLKESVWVTRALRMSRTQTPDSGSWLCAPLSFQNVLYWASFCVGLNEHGFKSFFPTHWLEGRLNFSESQCPLLLKQTNTQTNR